MLEKEKDKEQPIEMINSAWNKIALQVCLVLIIGLFVMYVGIQTEIMIGGMSISLITLPFVVFLLWKQRPIWVELYSDRMRYHTFVGKEREVFYTELKSIDFKKNIYTVNTIIPIYGYTKYSIYVSKENGKTHKINMNTLAYEDFDRIVEIFLHNCETHKEIELCENMKNSYFNKKFFVPVRKLRETYYYIGKRVGIVLVGILGIDSLWNVLKDSESILDWVAGGMGVLVEIIICAVVFYLFGRALYRKEIAASKKVPEEVYVCYEYMEIDGEKFLFNKITEGSVVSANFHCDRKIQFTYEGIEYEIHFGKFREFLPEYFPEYKTLELYLCGRGFSGVLNY